MAGMDDYLAGFGEDPGYLDFAAFGPLSAAVRAEADAQQTELTRGRFGTWDSLARNVDRLRAAAAAVTGFRDDQIAFQPSTTEGLAHAMFGVTGGILMSQEEYPSLTSLATRASDTLKATAPLWLDTDHGRVTPGQIRDQLTSTTSAVAVSAVDARTGFVADLEGIREVIGERLLVVDAVQGVGAIEAPWQVADVLAVGGQKWLRAGFGCAVLAVSDRAANRLTPVFSGPSGFPGGELVFDRVPNPAPGAAGLQLGGIDWAAAARLAVAFEDLAEAGTAAVAKGVAERATQVIGMADEAGIPVVSPRARHERAGIVVLEPHPQQLTPLTVALSNHGVSTTVREGRVRISPHAGTTPETLRLLRASLVAYASATRVYR